MHKTLNKEGANAIKVIKPYKFGLVLFLILWNHLETPERAILQP